ncbi:hypothetical protein D3C72_1654120 [compost metagenome]
MLAEAGDKCRTLARPRRHFPRGDDQRRATGYRHDDFQYMQRVGDFLARQHLLDGQRLAEEHRLFVDLGIAALVDGNLGHGPRVITVLGGVTLGDHRVTGVLAHVPVRQVELRLRRAVGRAVSAEAHGAGHPARVFIRPQRRHACWQHAEYRLTHAQFDSGSCPPDHTHRSAATEVDDFGEVQLQAQVFRSHGRHEYRGLVKVRAVDHQPVNVLGA